jgi:hypothetical protein
MIADAMYNRESALYVDYVEHDGEWSRPASARLPRMFANHHDTRLASVSAALDQARTESLFSAGALGIINEEFRDHFCKAGSDRGVAIILDRLAQRLRSVGVAISDETLLANFMRLPLYAMIVAPDKALPNSQGLA